MDTNNWNHKYETLRNNELVSKISHLIYIYMILRVCWMTWRQAWLGCACPASADLCLFDVGEHTYTIHDWVYISLEAK